MAWSPGDHRKVRGRRAKVTVRHRSVARLIVCVILSEDCFNPSILRSLSLSLEIFACFFHNFFSIASVNTLVLVRCLLRSVS